jgi:hypothetical protein
MLDEQGRLLGGREFPADHGGYRQLLSWLGQHGQVGGVGAEGTGSYGAGLAGYLLDQQVRVVEVDRPDRRTRRQRGRSDPIDAEAAARAVLAGTATAVPKRRDGIVEAIRVGCRWTPVIASVNGTLAARPVRTTSPTLAPWALPSRRVGPSRRACMAAKRRRWCGAQTALVG